LAIAREPTRFLSVVQLGSTLIGVLAGAYAGTTVTEVLTGFLGRFGFLAPHAHAVALALVVGGLTLCSVVIGQLIPKRFGLASPERIALYLAPAINNLARAGSPIIGLLTWIVDRTMKLFGLKAQATEKSVSDEEINTLIEQGLHSGAFNKTEKEMVAGVLELDQLPVTALMTPRPKIVFLNLDDPEEANWRKIVASGHSYFPVYQGNRDQVIGLVSVKALWAHSAIGLTTSLKNLMVPALIVPETMTAFQLLESFKKSSRHIALISDEFGAIQGLTTLIDVLEAIVGDMPAQGRRDAPGAKQREDGSWLVDATLAIAEVKSMLKLDTLPHENEADFQTLGGFVVTYFGRIPSAGDFFDHLGWRFEVVDMDRHRVDKVLVAKTPAAEVEKVAG
jgi:putative hemolysin